MRRARYSITVGSVYDGHNPLLPIIGPKDHECIFQDRARASTERRETNVKLVVADVLNLDTVKREAVESE